MNSINIFIVKTKYKLKFVSTHLSRHGHREHDGDLRERSEQGDEETVLLQGRPVHCDEADGSEVSAERDSLKLNIYEI